MLLDKFSPSIYDGGTKLVAIFFCECITKHIYQILETELIALLFIKVNIHLELKFAFNNASW